MGSRILHYEFVTGESVNITVSAEIAEVIYDSRRMEHASNERSRYHTAFSLDSEDYEGTNLVSEKTPDDLIEELEDREHLLDCLAHLPSIVQAEQIFTVDKSRVDDAVRASLALNPMGEYSAASTYHPFYGGLRGAMAARILTSARHEGCSTRSFKRQSQ